MKRSLLVLTAGLFGLAPICASAQSFNLVCKGEQIRVVSDQPAVQSRFVATFRVDLDRGQFCREPCEGISKLAAVDANTITLVNEDDVQGKYMIISGSVRVNRLTAAYSEDIDAHSGLAHIITGRRGKCEQKPFGGFPTPKF